MTPYAYHNKEHFKLFVLSQNQLQVLRVKVLRHLWMTLHSIRYCTTNFRKMTFMAVNMMLNGALMIVLPFVKNFGLLVTFRFLQATNKFFKEKK